MEDQKKKEKIRNILLVVVAGLTGYTLVLWYLSFKTLETTVQVVEKTAVEQSKNYRHYVHEYHATKKSLDESNQKVVDLTTELAAANTELSTTRTELTSIQGLNDQLKQGIQQLENYKAKALAKGEALETMIGAFKKKNRQLDADLQSVRKELALFSPDVSDTEEGRAKILRFKDHIRMVKKNIHVLREQAQTMKIAAQQQHDRLEALYGNNGYLVKDGKNQALKRQNAKVDIKVEFK